MNKQCPKCQGNVETGVATGKFMGSPYPITQPSLVFVIPGAPTSSNPLTALKQGLHEEPPDRGYWIKGSRCAKCGFVELYANEEANL